MSVQITPDSDPDALARRLTGGPDPESLRSSEARRRLLERWADVLTETDLSVDFTDEHGKTAHVTLGDSDPEIVVPSWEIDQPLTDLDQEAYDLLLQRTLTLHEVGHVLFTDGQALTQAKRSLPAQERELFHMVFNSLEDGAIEEQLRQEFDVAGDIELTNANFRFEYDDGTRVYDLQQATRTACLNLAVHDSGHLAELLDETNDDAKFDSDDTRDTFESEVLPEIRAAVPDILAEPDPQKRVDRIVELWEAIRDHFTDYELPDDASDPEADLDPQRIGDGGTANGLSSTDETAVADHGEDVVDGTAESRAPVTEQPPDGASQGATDDEVDDPRGDDQSSGDPSDQPSSGTDGHTGGGEATGGGDKENMESSHRESDESTERDSRSSRDRTPEGENGDRVSPEEGQSGTTEENDSSEASPNRPNTNQTEDSNDGTQPEDDDPEEMPDRTNVGDERDQESSPEGSDSGMDSGVSDSGDKEDSADSATGDSDGGGNGSGSEDLDSDDSVPEPGEETEADDQSADDRSTDESEDAVDPRDVDEDSDVERQYDRLLDRQRRSEEADRRAFEEAIEEYADVLERIRQRDLEPTGLDIADGTERRQAGWSDIRKDSNQLKRILEQRLQQERRSTQRRGQRRGQLDTRSLNRLARDDPRVFRQEEDPDEKDYSFVFVLDRSGSMGSEIEAAERALVTLARALEEIDIEVSIIDMYQSSARLAKPFGVQTENVLDRLMTGSTGGSTPLSEVLRLARERIQGGEGNPAMIVLTDGEPNDKETYLEELQQTNFPVVGVYLAVNASSRNQVAQRFDDSQRLYDRRRIVTSDSDLATDLRGLCREIMF
jgi:uncharacterized protein YegL